MHNPIVHNIITGWFEILIAYVVSYLLKHNPMVSKILHGDLKCCKNYYMVSALTAM